MRSIMVALSTAGARAFRNQVGQYELKDGRWIASGLCVGSSDLIGWTKDGRFLAVEVKTPAGRITKEQQHFLDAVNAAGGVAFVARSPQEAITELNKRA